MDAKIDILRVKDTDGSEYAVYPKTLIRCVTNENGDNLEDTLQGFLDEKLNNEYVKKETVDGLQASISATNTAVTMNTENIAAIQTSVTAIVAGTTPVAKAVDSDTVDGYHASDFAKSDRFRISDTGWAAIDTEADENGTKYRLQVQPAGNVDLFKYTTESNTWTRVARWNTDYLPLTGGTVNGSITANRYNVNTLGCITTFNSSDDAKVIALDALYDDTIARVSVYNYADGTSKITLHTYDGTKWNHEGDFIHSGNIADHALSINGGTIDGNVIIRNQGYAGSLQILRDDAGSPGIRFDNANGILGYFTTNGNNGQFGRMTADGTSYYLLDSGNVGTYAIPSTGGAVTGTSKETLSNNQVRNISAGTTDMTAGTTALAAGDIYIFYEA